MHFSNSLSPLASTVALHVFHTGSLFLASQSFKERTSAEEGLSLSLQTAQVALLVFLQKRFLEQHALSSLDQSKLFFAAASLPLLSKGLCRVFQKRAPHFSENFKDLDLMPLVQTASLVHSFALLQSGWTAHLALNFACHAAYGLLYLKAYVNAFVEEKLQKQEELLSRKIAAQKQEIDEKMKTLCEKVLNALDAQKQPAESFSSCINPLFQAIELVSKTSEEQVADIRSNLEQIKAEQKSQPTRVAAEKFEAKAVLEDLQEQILTIRARLEEGVGLEDLESFSDQVFEGVEERIAAAFEREKLKLEEELERCRSESGNKKDVLDLVPEKRRQVEVLNAQLDVCYQELLQHKKLLQHTYEGQFTERLGSLGETGESWESFYARRESLLSAKRTPPLESAKCAPPLENDDWHVNVGGPVGDDALPGNLEDCASEYGAASECGSTISVVSEPVWTFSEGGSPRVIKGGRGNVSRTGFRHSEELPQCPRSVAAPGREPWKF